MQTAQAGKFQMERSVESPSVHQAGERLERYGDTLPIHRKERSFAAIGMLSNAVTALRPSKKSLVLKPP
jgi:hypothetical protein